MIIFILTAFMFMSHYCYGLTEDGFFSFSGYPLFAEDVETRHVDVNPDVRFAVDSDVWLKVEFCNSLKMAADCFFVVEGLWDILLCKWEWEPRVKALNKKVQKTRFAISEGTIQSITSALYKKIDICREKVPPVGEAVSCAKSEVLKANSNVFGIYQCSTLLLRISRL